MAKDTHDTIKLKTGGGKGKKETKVIDAGDKKKGEK